MMWGPHAEKSLETPALGEHLPNTRRALWAIVSPYEGRATVMLFPQPKKKGYLL